MLCISTCTTTAAAARCRGWRPDRARRCAHLSLKGLDLAPSLDSGLLLLREIDGHLETNALAEIALVTREVLKVSPVILLAIRKTEKEERKGYRHK